MLQHELDDAKIFFFFFVCGTVQKRVKLVDLYKKLQNVHLIFKKIGFDTTETGFDTAEDGPSEVWVTNHAHSRVKKRVPPKRPSTHPSTLPSNLPPPCVK